MNNNDDRIIRIEAKIDKIVDHISSIDVTLASQHVSLKDHIRRTEILESEIKPVKKHVDLIQACVKMLGIAVGLAAIVESLVILLEYIRKI